MPKTALLFFISFIFFSGYSFARAEIVINEVELSPTAERFLELYNTGDSAIDLTGWYMQRKTATGSSFGSLVSNPNFEGKSIEPHDYFLISKNSLANADIVLDSLTLTESNTIQIKNSEGEVIDKIGWGEASDCDNSCPPNPSEGRSIQKSSSGSWIVSVPTPGKENGSGSAQESRDDEDDEEEGGEAQEKNSSNSATETKTKVVENKTIKVKITTENLVFMGQPFEMKVDISGFSGENIVLGKAYWNFGDGSSLEQVNNFTKFYHAYDYPGEYAVFLEYYRNSSSKIPEVVSKMTIKVIPIAVTISRIGDTKDFFIELSNNAISDINVSNWSIHANGKIFMLPKNSVIMSKKKMIISGKINGFAYGDQYNLKLFSSTGEMIYDYAFSVVPVAATSPNKIVVQPKVSSQIIEPKNTEVDVPEKESLATEANNSEENAGNLLASAYSSDAVKNSPIRTYLLSTIFTLFLGVSAGGVYFIRQRRTKKNNLSQIGNDFDILND